MSEQYWSVPREWPGETFFLLGGGPSLRGFDARILQGQGRVIAINNSYLLAPWADVLYFSDSPWWESHKRSWRDLEGMDHPGVLDIFTGRYRVSLGTSEDETERLRTTGETGLEHHPTGLKRGGNSGYQAINLAHHFGAGRIVLLGYDMKTNGNRTHWHAGHERETVEGQDRRFRQMFLPAFTSLVEPLREAGIEVVNATLGSALACWPPVALSEILIEVPVTIP
jgi:hypothetical protein